MVGFVEMKSPQLIQERQQLAAQILEEKKRERRRRKEGEKPRKLFLDPRGFHARFWGRIKGWCMQFFFHILQPSLAVSWGEKSRGNSAKISDSKGERLRVISGAKIKPKSMF